MIVILILKLLLFIIPISFYNFAQSQWDIIQQWESREEIVVHYPSITQDQSLDLPKIQARVPKTWRSGEERDVYYEVLSWNHPTQSAQITFYTSSELSNLGSPVVFLPNQETSISKKITLPTNHTGWVKTNINGQIQMGSYSADIEPITIFLVDQAELDAYQKAHTTNQILFWVTLVLVVLICIFWW